MGVAAGCLALLVTGLADASSVTQGGISGAAILAAGMSVGLASLVLQVLGTLHPPAGATTLIVSIGLLTAPDQLLRATLAVAFRDRARDRGQGVRRRATARPAGGTRGA